MRAGGDGHRMLQEQRQRLGQVVADEGTSCTNDGIDDALLSFPPAFSFSYDQQRNSKTLHRRCRPWTFAAEAI